MIPTIIKMLSGDKSKAAHYLGLAKRQLDILLRQMQLAQPKPLKIDQRKLDLNKNGAYILVSACYNTHVMKIHIPTWMKKEDKKEIGKNCFSLPHFALGKITAVYPSLTDDYTEEDYDEYIELLHDQRMTYNLNICTGEFYILAENVLDANFGRYYVSQKVLVTIGADEETWQYALDPYRDNLMDLERFSTLMISPLSVTNMNLWSTHGL